jgi:tRNA modification GTPase
MLKIGFRQANRGEYTFRAFINGKTDLTKAEAVKEIIDSHTDASRSHAAGRLAGSLFQEIDDIKKLIVDTLAAIEVEIEYPEDEETIADSFDREDIETAARRLEALVDSWRGEKLYQDGARVVLAGRTNAGKSSLFNAILKEERAIVSDIEGTTRDWIESWVSFDGVPARLFDTAGLRETDDVIEARGVEMTKELSSDADIILYLVDSSAGLTKDDEDFLLHAKESYDVPLILIWNKVDKLGEEQSKATTGIVDEKSQVKICAKTGLGIEELSHLVKEKLSLLSSLDRGAALGSERQKNAVAQALESITHALEATKAGYALDAAVQDMEDALDFLGEVTGEVTSEDVLDSIFSHFCVGK